MMVLQACLSLQSLIHQRLVALVSDTVVVQLVQPCGNTYTHRQSDIVLQQIHGKVGGGKGGVRAFI